MHCEKNVTMSILHTILAEKDNKNVKVDLQDLRVCEELWLKPHPTKTGETTMPLTPWVMPKDDMLMVNVKLSTCFVSGF
jgi:hypothetical protein